MVKKADQLLLLAFQVDGGGLLFEEFGRFDGAGVDTTDIDTGFAFLRADGILELNLGVNGVLHHGAAFFFS